MLGSIVLGDYQLGSTGEGGDPGDEVSASQPLSLINTVDVEIESPGVFAENDLGLTNSVVVTQVYPASNQLNLSQEVSVRGPIYLSVQHHLSLNQELPPEPGVIGVDVGQPLNLTSRVGQVLELTAGNTLSFVQEGDELYPFAHQLNLVQTLAVGKSGNPETEISFTQTVLAAGEYRPSVTSAISFNQLVTYYVVRACIEKQYSPFVGGSVPGYTPPPTTPPTLTKTKLTLTFPFISPTTTLELRNPESGDKDRLIFNRINRNTRGGTLIVFADPTWPKLQVLAMQVDSLSEQQAADLIAFIRDSLGQEIGLLDWEGRQWKGIITTPDARITHVAKKDRSVAFEFQGF